MLDRFKEFELKIKTENLPLSIKYEYLKSLNELLKTYEYSFFAFEEGFNSLRKSFNHDVYVFNILGICFVKGKSLQEVIYKNVCMCYSGYIKK